MNKLNIAVVGSGISGLSAAWLLSRRHTVTVFEADTRAGGHAHTERFGDSAIDVGFIVFNNATYPNFSALLEHLDVPAIETDMSFSVSMEGGKIEYSGGSFGKLLGSPRTALSHEHWSMLVDLARFYRTAKALSRDVDDDVSLGTFLERHGFRDAFVKRHLVPMASAIWSSHPHLMLDYPARAFIDFFDNHQLLNLGAREKWRSVSGGSMSYVRKIIGKGLRLRTGDRVVGIARTATENRLRCASGYSDAFDHIVLATHADQALALLDEPTVAETALLSPFRYSDNAVVVHTDASLMPTRRKHWSSWNYMGAPGVQSCGVSYWMNNLQQLKTKTDYFVSLNPVRQPHDSKTLMQFNCTHPIFSTATLAAQKLLWELQGRQKTWFCGSYFGAGFHEDGLQAGLAVAEQLGGIVRPWTIANPSDRIFLSHANPGLMAAE